MPAMRSSSGSVDRVKEVLVIDHPNLSNGSLKEGN